MIFTFKLLLFIASPEVSNNCCNPFNDGAIFMFMVLCRPRKGYIRCIFFIYIYIFFIHAPVMSIRAFSQLRTCRPPPSLPSVLIRFLRMMWNVLNRMKKLMKKFSNFYFSSYREISSKIGVMTSLK